MELRGIVWYLIHVWLVNWLRSAGCILQDTYLLYHLTKDYDDKLLNCMLFNTLDDYNDDDDYGDDL